MVRGKPAVGERDAGLGRGEVSLVRSGFDSSPFPAGSTEVRAVLVRPAVMARGQALSSMQGEAAAQPVAGDRLTHDWIDQGWRYATTEHWTGKAWELVDVSAHRIDPVRT